MIVFDFDGVIADSLALYQQVCQQAAHHFNTDITLPKNPFAQLNPVTFEELAATLDLPCDAYATKVSELMNSNKAIPELFDGISSTLEQLASNTDLAVVSASHSTVLSKILCHYQIEQYFVQIIGGDTAGTKADKLQALSKTYSIMAMVGDGISDIYAAQKANIPSVAVTWGWQGEDMLVRANPDRIIRTPTELLTLV